jgi:hypothetical protein
MRSLICAEIALGILSKRLVRGLDEVRFSVSRVSPRREVLSCKVELVESSVGKGGEEAYCHEVVVFHEGLLVAGKEAEEGEDEGRDAAYCWNEGGGTHGAGVVLTVGGAM